MAGMLSESLVGRLKAAGEPGNTDPNETLFDDADPPDETASPEEQAQYDKFVDGAMKIMYGKGLKDEILKQLGGGDPVAEIGSIAANAAARMATEAFKAGEKIVPDVAFHGIKEIAEDLASYAQAGGIEVTPEQADGAFIRAVDEYREIGTAGGWLDPKEFIADFEEMQQADKQGNLGKLLPGIDGPKQSGFPPSNAPSGGVPQNPGVS